MNVKYDITMINAVKKDVDPIVNAISNVQKAVLLEYSLDILMAFSQDPLARVVKLLELLTKVSSDIACVARDIEKRKGNLAQNTNISESRYSQQNVIISGDYEIVNGWEA